MTTGPSIEGRRTKSTELAIQQGPLQITSSSRPLVTSPVREIDGSPVRAREEKSYYSVQIGDEKERMEKRDERVKLFAICVRSDASREQFTVCKMTSAQLD